MAVKPKPLMETIIGEAVRNWVVDTVVDHTMPMLKYVANPEDPKVLRYQDAKGEPVRFTDRENQREIRLEYMEAIYWLREKPKESRAVIISAGQGAYSAMARIPIKKILPVDKFPGLEPLLDFIFEQTGETLEQLPDSLRAYAAHEDHLPFPADFKPRDVKDVLTGFVGSMKDAIESSGQNIGEVLKGRVPALEGFLAPILKLVPKFDQVKEGYQHLVVLEVVQPELLGPWLDFIADLPRDKEDDLRRADARLTPKMVGWLLATDRPKAIKLIERLAPDSTSEVISEAVADVVGPLNAQLDSWGEALDRWEDKFKDAPASTSTPRVEGISIRGYERIRQVDLDELIRFGT